ncbi:serine/threonine-protein phosphatase PGAM5, mitochondrial isoform X3 [Bemisia tabaci]|uniref:serine/threonine-protein phosphatase PGAM5, mitochondrial isoform X3 n=1 Tax=Bemisia tabaci TaxID=7038 RepID=UPI0008F9C237|nr:PREDICTED: serine/threonine-protein phosphatase PGAM5, mitochondrial-like isoform X3 [Bemisia tabaci]
MTSKTFRLRILKVATHGITACCGAAVTYYYLIKIPKESISTAELTSSSKWDHNWDKRDPASLVNPLKKNGDPAKDNKYNEELEKLKSKATRHLILIRHGQYYLSGKTDQERVLTPLGRRQAELTGSRLQALNLPYNSIIHSSMQRAIETATIIHKFLPDVPMSSCSMLEEGAPYPPEPQVSHWKPEAVQFLRDGARIEAAFRKYFHRAPPSQKEDSYEIIVCHANVIRYFVCRALQFPPEGWLRILLCNASISMINISSSGRVSISTLGDVGFMPIESISHT